MTDPMITAANTLEASPKPSYGPHKANERYLDGDDRAAMESMIDVNYRATLHAHAPEQPNVTIAETLQALETLRTHLRRKYYGG